jgi:hypothetical protein
MRFGTMGVLSGKPPRRRVRIHGGVSWSLVSIPQGNRSLPTGSSVRDPDERQLTTLRGGPTGDWSFSSVGSAPSYYLGEERPGMTGSSLRPRNTSPSPWPQCSEARSPARRSRGKRKMSDFSAS